MKLNIMDSYGMAQNSILVFLEYANVLLGIQCDGLIDCCLTMINKPCKASVGGDSTSVQAIGEETDKSG